MNMEIISKKDNTVLSRAEVVLVARYEGATPSLSEIRQKVIETLGSSPDLTVIKRTEQNFGKREVKIWAHIYDDPSVLHRLEPIYVLKRNKLASV